MILSERTFTAICLVQAMDIANIIVFRKRMIEINTAMQKIKNLKKLLCT